MPDLRIVTALPQSLRPAYEALLASAGLRDEGDADCTALLSSGGGALLACGSVSGRVLKQIAVAPWAEGDGACARIVTALLEESARRGGPPVSVYQAEKCPPVPQSGLLPGGGNGGYADDGAPPGRRGAIHRLPSGV